MKITEKLKLGQLLISDGAWGTLLMQKGMKAGECPELWNINNADAVYEIAKSYIDAGADMIETNSFGGNRFKLEMFGLANQTFELNKAAAEISRKAAKEKIVMGSVGPTGKILMMGDVTEQELYDVYKEQCMALEKGGADAIIFETMSDIDEARIAIKAAKENTSCEIVCTFTFEKTITNEYRTMMGASPSYMVNQLVSEGVNIIGANCGNGIDGMIDIVKEIRSVNKTIPVLIHANAGLPILKDGKTFYPETPEQMASMVNKLKEAGANIIGGCCGTTPEHIRMMGEKKI